MTGSAAVSAVGALNEVWYHSVDTEESQVLRYHPVFKTSAGTASVMKNTFSVTNTWSDRIYRSYDLHCWLFAFVLKAPNFWVPSYDSNPEFHCPEKWTSALLAKVYTMICYSGFGGIPLGVVVYLYTRVVYTLWDRKVNLTSAPSEQIIIQNRKKVTKMVIVMK